jgi:hypothetical protein
LTWEFDATNTIHARHIVTDHRLEDSAGPRAGYLPALRDERRVRSLPTGCSSTGHVRRSR